MADLTPEELDIMDRYASMVNAHAHEVDLERCYCRDVPRLVEEVKRLRIEIEKSDDENERLGTFYADIMSGPDGLERCHAIVTKERDDFRRALEKIVESNEVDGYVLDAGAARKVAHEALHQLGEKGVEGSDEPRK